MGDFSHVKVKLMHMDSFIYTFMLSLAWPRSSELECSLFIDDDDDDDDDDDCGGSGGNLIMMMVTVIVMVAYVVIG